ncbi:hypothetical protein [Aeromonas molluscorum]
MPESMLESILFGHNEGGLHRRERVRSPASSSRRRAGPCCSTKSPNCR